MPHDLPPGWTSTSGVVEPAARVSDFAARGQSVKGVCRSPGCFRRVELNAAALGRIGLGALPMSQVQRLWMCQRLDGCGLDFHAEPPLFPLRLEQFVGRPNVRLRLRCRAGGCKFFRIYRVEQMIEGLRRRGVGDGRTEVIALGAQLTGGCPACKRVNWTAEVLYVSPDTMGWKALGEASFDSAATFRSRS